MILSGLERLGLVRGPGDPKLESIKRFMEKEQNKFEPVEIHQLVALFHHGPNDAVIDTLFPGTWKELVASSRQRLTH